MWETFNIRTVRSLQKSPHLLSSIVLNTEVMSLEILPNVTHKIFVWVIIKKKWNTVTPSGRHISASVLLSLSEEKRSKERA